MKMRFRCLRNVFKRKEETEEGLLLREERSNRKIYLGLEEVLSACNADFVDINLGKSGQLAQSGILLQFTGSCLTINQ